MLHMLHKLHIVINCAINFVTKFVTKNEMGLKPIHATKLNEYNCVCE